MTHYRWGLLLPLALGVFTALAGRAYRPLEARRSPSQRTASQAVRSVGRTQPLHFEENRGQSAGDGRFLSRGRGYALALDSRGASLTLAPSGTDGRAGAARRGATTRLELRGANPDARLVGLDRQRGVVNYLVGHDPKKWRTHIPTYKKVRYEAVYPGVDLVYHGDQGSLEYDFVVQPGADPSQIRLSATGADNVEIADNGDLLIHLAGGTVTQKKPVAYQLVDGKKHEVPAEFTLRRTPGFPLAGTASRRGGHALHLSHEVAFTLARYDATEPLIIDPVLAFSTYLGGNDFEEPQAVTCSSDGSIYVTGQTSSADFPTTSGVLDESFNGWLDAFVTRFAGDGSLVYSTYLGGNHLDRANGIALDGSGGVYLAGLSYSPDFPIVAPSASTGGGAGDGFVAKLAPDGSAVVWSTLMGGAGWDTIEGFARDGDGNLHVAGLTQSSDFPTQHGLYGDAANDDAFAAEISADGSSVLYSTYLGGAGADGAQALGVDSAGDTYVVGGTSSSDFPTTGGAALPAFAGSFDGFVTKLVWNGSVLSVGYSTYLGGSGGEEAAAVAVGSDGSAYVTGYTDSTDFPMAPAGSALFEDHPGGTANGFVAKVTTAGDALAYSTYLGGSGEDWGTAIAVDPAGGAYVTGATASDDFPVSRALYDTRQGGYDLFVTEIKPGATALGYSTYLGGGANDQPVALALSTGENPVVVGSTVGTFPLEAAADSTAEGWGEGFVARIVDTPTAPAGLAIAEGASHRPVLTWSGGSGADSFAVERKPYGAPDSSWDSAFGTTDQTSVEDTTAERGFAYDYRVRSFSRHGNSDYCDPATYIPAPPAAPSGVTAAFGDTGDFVQLSWTDNSDDELAFRIQRQDPFTGWSDMLTVGPDGTAGYDPAPQPFLVYRYRVVAFNHGGDSTPSGAVLAAPAAPYDLRAAAQSTARVNLTWSTDAGNQDGSEIEARRGSGPWERIIVLPGDGLRYEHADLLPNTTYAYRVRNYIRDQGEVAYSGWSDPASAVTVSNRPEAPGSFQVFSPDRGRVVLTWMDNAADEAGFKVYRRTGSSGAFTLLDTVPADANTYTDGTTTGDTQYSYTVAAYNDRGASPAAKEQTVTTLWGPESLTASAVTTAQINLTWKDMSLYEDGYSIERRKGAGVYVEAARVSGKIGKNQTVTYSDTGLTTGVSYTYRVRAYNTRATSLYANGTSITTTGAAEPGLQVTPTAKSYGRVVRGQARTATFTVRNTGKKWEAVTIPALGGAFQVLGSRHFTLSTGASRTFKVRFTAGKVGAFAAELPVRCQHGEVVKVKLHGRSVRG
jgi:fibronectin type 3 domain-containing protein